MWKDIDLFLSNKIQTQLWLSYRNWRQTTEMSCRSSMSCPTHIRERPQGSRLCQYVFSPGERVWVSIQRSAQNIFSFLYLSRIVYGFLHKGQRDIKEDARLFPGLLWRGRKSLWRSFPGRVANRKKLLKLFL